MNSFQEGRAKTIDWFCNGDTGASSMAMACAIFGAGIAKKKEHPWDSSDFGRCYRYLKVIPEAVEYLPRVAGISPTWGRIISKWDDLSALYEGGMYEALDKHLDELQ